MLETTEVARVARNLVIYGIAVGLLVYAALGLAEAIELSVAIAIPLFLVGLALIFFVHESLDGPF
ncbi:hypothetical protein [Halorubrum vacuolatum]|uniref:Uncharacterized protein n=1 Tax=Halorubrum vacuolatum TaxID=63740 RepID=A0A238UVI5_HALVU|nr:hypothetical protein [Halorubrum vacuolatum]SNR26202.1 hypothetical protein SAMN06264855_101457 [Halorubrum vacuolatum]